MKIPIGTRLKLGLLFPMFFVIVLGIVSFVQSNKHYEKTEALYSKTLMLERSISMLNTYIISLHRDMKDLSIDSAQKEIDIELDWIKWWQLRASGQIDTIHIEYEGPQSDIDSLVNDYAALNTLCEKTIELMRSGKKSEVLNRIKTNGIISQKVEKLQAKLEEISILTIKKDDKLHMDLVRLGSTFNRNMLILVILVLLFSLGISFVLTRNVTLRKQVEEALSQSEDIFKYFFEHSIVGKSLTLPAGEIDVNQAFCGMLGYSSTEFKNKKWQEITHPEDIELTQREVDQLLSGKRDSTRFIKRFIHKDGSVVWVDLSSSIRRDHDGKPLYLMSSVIDITERKQAEEDLLKMDALLRITGHSAKVGGWEVDTETMMQTWTEEVYAIHEVDLAFNPNVSTGISFYAPMSRPVIEKAVQRAIEFGEPFDLELEFITNKGNYRWVRSIGEAKQINGRTKKVYGSIQDITERKKAELALAKSEKSNRFIVENVGEGIGFVNTNEEFAVVNPAAERIFGLGKGELIGKNLKELLSSEEYMRILNQTEIRKKGESSSYEFELIRPDGAKRNILITAVPQFDEDEKFIGTHGIFRDFTESRQAQKVLMENERKLYQLNIDKDRFISILGHDLKNPFNNILGFSEVLTEDIRKLSLGDIEDIAKNINKSARITNKLLDEILMWAKMQQGKIPFEPQNLNFTDICMDTLEILNQAANAKNISINCLEEDQLNVFADNEMLKTVLRNLVSNAIKFTNNGGAININAVRNSENVTISVSDNGVGIPPVNLAKLFDISQVLTTTGTANETGTGLGLLLCKEFVERHGGKIWIESEAGNSCEIIFTLPVSIKPAT